MRNSNQTKTKRQCFLTTPCSEPYFPPRPLMWLNWKPSSVPGFTTFSILGRGGKGDQEQRLTKSRRGRGRRQKKSFLKKMGRGGKMSRSLSCTYNTKWRKFGLEGKSWGIWPPSPRVGVGGQRQQQPGTAAEMLRTAMMELSGGSPWEPGSLCCYRRGCVLRGEWRLFLSSCASSLLGCC